jgi:hypothetical protein
MSLSRFNEVDRQVILECVRAAVAGPFFPRWEFYALFGLEHEELADIAFAEGPLDDSRDDVRLAIGGTLNNLTGYPHRKGRDVWDRYISASPEEVLRITEQWFAKFG